MNINYSVVPTAPMETEDSSEQVACLIDQGFTTSLAHAVVLQHQVCGLRIWILDNSGSMGEETDGKRLLPTLSPNAVKWEEGDCTRWDELTECVMYHAQLAALCLAPTEFHLLNAPNKDLPQRCSVAEGGPDRVEKELQTLLHTLSSITPSGDTPLASCIHQIYSRLQNENSLLQRKKKVVVVLATDGLPTDSNGCGGRKAEIELEAELEKLQQLNVWIVVRLCTNEERVISYYQELDNRLEWNLEVLDDFIDEAKQVYKYNPWLNYCLPLHRCREMACCQYRLLDVLNERKITMDEMVDLLRLVLGNNVATTHDPHVDWSGFLSNVKTRLCSESHPWNPIYRKTAPWIDVRELQSCYGPQRRKLSRIVALVAAMFLMAAAFVGTVYCSSLVVDVPSRNQVEGLLSMALGIVTIVIVLGKNPQVLWDKGLIGICVFTGLAACLYDKPRDFWIGVAWMTGGFVLLVVVLLLKLRDM